MKTLYVTALVISFFSLVEGNVDELIEKFPQHFLPVCRLISDELGPYKKKSLCSLKLFIPPGYNPLHITRFEIAKCLFCHETCDNDDVKKAKKNLLKKMKMIPKI